MASAPPPPDGFEVEPPLPAGFEKELANDTGASAPADYRPKLQQMFDAGAPKSSIESFVRLNGVDPSQLDNLDAAIAYRDKGGKGVRVLHKEDGGTAVVPADQGLGRALKLGVGDVAQGAGDLLGLVANPVNTALNMTGLPQRLMGQDLGTDLGQTFRDAVTNEQPVTSGERMVSAVDRAGAGSLGFAGAGTLASSAPGIAGDIARVVAANPVRDFISGLTGGAGAEAGQRVGGTPGAIVGGLAGGAAGALSAAKIGERLASRFPRSVMVSPEGGLTQDGQEIAHRTGADPESVVQAYRNPARNLDDPAAAPNEYPQPVQQWQSTTARSPRYDEAASEGVQLTRGQSEQAFKTQNDENSLRVSATKEGQQARDFYGRQTDQINQAVARFRQSFGGDLSPAERGDNLRQAVSDLRDSGAEGVRQLYRQAESLGGDGLKLDTTGIHDAATDVLMDEAVPENVKRSVSQELARYGIIGTAEPTNEAGITKVALDDGSSISFRGQIKTLTASNAEDMRRAINRLYDPTKPNLSGQSIKPAIDDALEQAVTTAANDPQEGQIGNAYRAARDAHIAQKQTYSAKDIIDSLTASKKGTNTPAIMPEKAVAQVIGQGPGAITNIKKVKTLLLASGQPQARQAWWGIQQQAIADIFDGAMVRNSNLGGELGNISGAKLRTMIHEKYGISKLKAILDDSDFNQLMKLSRVIGHATIPLSGTTNPSGTFTKLANFLGKGALRATGLGHVTDAAAALASKARDLAVTRRTLEGITSYDGRVATGAKLDQQARDFIKEYIRVHQSGALIPTSINLGRPEQGQK